MSSTLVDDRSLLAGTVPVGVALAVVLCGPPLAFMFSSSAFSNLLFFLPQFVFPWGMTWKGMNPVPFGIVLDLVMWVGVAVAFSWVTRRMVRWVTFLLGPVVVATTVLVVHQVIRWLGLRFLVDSL